MPTTTVLISEVGPRDGLQSISRVMPLEAKQAWIAAEAAAAALGDDHALAVMVQVGDDFAGFL